MLDLNVKFLEPGETLICFGDSLTFADPGYVSILQNKLTENTVINAGQGGDKAATAMLRFKEQVLDKKPDGLSIFFGANDAMVGRGRWADEPMISPEAYRNSLVWLVHVARLSGIKKISIIVPLPLTEGEVWHEQGDIYASYCMMARQAANEMKVPYVPLDTIFRDEWRKNPGKTGLLFTADGVHPTQEGYQIIAESILKYWHI